MKLTPEQRSAWRELIEAASRTYALAPWEWMREDDVFALQDPDSEKIGFVVNRHSPDGGFLIEILLGSRALHDYQTLRKTGAHAAPMEMEENLLLVPRLEASVHSDRPLEEWESELFRSLDGWSRNSGPRFRSVHPGHLPWMPEDDEIRFLTRAFEQYRQIALRKRKTPQMLDCNGTHRYLVREPLRRDHRIEWHDRIRHFPPPAPVSIPIVWNQSDVDHLNHMPKQNHIVEADFFLFSGEFAEPGQRPLSTYMLMMVHAQSDLILCAEPMTVVTSLERLWGAVPGVLASSLANFDIRPRKIRVRSTPLLQLLKPLQAAVDFELERCAHLQRMDATRETMQAFLQQHVPDSPR